MTWKTLPLSGKYFSKQQLSAFLPHLFVIGAEVSIECVISLYIAKNASVDF